MRKLAVIAAVLIFGIAGAQAQMDVAFGAGTVNGNPSNFTSFLAGTNGAYSPQGIAAGTYLAFSGDYVFWHNLGFGGAVAWRAGQAYWGGTLPYRPILFDFDGVFAPKFGKHLGVELKAGIGAESLHFYTGSYSCGYFGCSNYQSSTHFMGDFGAGIKLYATDHVFIRPEATVYLVHNNFEFSGPRVVRYGVSIGYTFGGQ